MVCGLVANEGVSLGMGSGEYESEAVEMGDSSVACEGDIFLLSKEVLLRRIRALDAKFVERWSGVASALVRISCNVEVEDSGVLIEPLTMGELQGISPEKLVSNVSGVGFE